MADSGKKRKIGGLSVEECKFRLKSGRSNNCRGIREIEQRDRETRGREMGEIAKREETGEIKDKDKRLGMVIRRVW